MYFVLSVEYAQTVSHKRNMNMGWCICFIGTVTGYFIGGVFSRLTAPSGESGWRTPFFVQVGCLSTRVQGHRALYLFYLHATTKPDTCRCGTAGMLVLRSFIICCSPLPSHPWCYSLRRCPPPLWTSQTEAKPDPRGKGKTNLIYSYTYPVFS